MTQRTHSPHKGKTDSRGESAPAQPQTAAGNTLSGLVQRAQADPGSLTPADVMALQRSVGNRATAGLLRPVVQMQGLRVGPASDRYEQEADRVARQVVNRVQTPPVQREGAAEEELQMKPLTPTVTPLQRKTFQKPVQREGGDEDELQMKAVASAAPTVQRAVNHGVEGGEVEASVAQQIQRAGGGGKPLDEKVRGQMERGFGADFSGVRVHTGAQADTLNRSLNARAFTTGKDIFFKRGEYNPGSGAGKQLLAHELTHTVQQGAAGVQRQVVQRAVGFEFETGYKIEKEQENAWVPLYKTEVAQHYPNNIDLTADERSSGDTAIELVLQPPVQETDEKKFIKAVKTFQKVGNAFHGLKEQRRYPLDTLKGPIKGPKGYAITPNRAGFLGNPQLTGGVALDKLYQFLSTAGDKQGKHKQVKGHLDQFAHKMRPSLVPVNNINGSDELKGLVAMLVLYLRKGCENDKLLNYAKLISAGFMARTDFGSIFNKLPERERVQFMMNPDTFVNLVLSTAGNLAPDEPVFKRGVRKSNQVDSNDYDTNALDQTPVGKGLNITRKHWLTRITRGYDLLSSDNMPELKSDLEGLGALGGRTDRVGNDPEPLEGSHDKGRGIIVELRQMGDNMLPDKVSARVLNIFKYIRALNNGEI